jgi:hypothetical protein
MRTFALAAALCGAAFLAGCVTHPGTANAAGTNPAATHPVEIRTVTIAGGETVRLPVERGDARPVETAEVKVQVAGFVADHEKQEIVYVFGFREKKGRTPRAVMVEDVTGSEAAVLVDDPAPRLSRDGYWTGKAAPQRKGNPWLAWLADAGDTFKIYRLTITTADGRKLVLFQATVFGTALKATFRQMLGYAGEPAT